MNTLSLVNNVVSLVSYKMHKTCRGASSRITLQQDERETSHTQNIFKEVARYITFSLSPYYRH